MFSPPVRIAIDPDNILVLEDHNISSQVRIRVVGQIRADNQRRLQQRPRREMALRFLVCQVPYRRALIGIPQFHDVEVVAAVEVRRPVREARLVNGGCDAAMLRCCSTRA